MLKTINKCNTFAKDSTFLQHKNFFQLNNLEFKKNWIIIVIIQLFVCNATPPKLYWFFFWRISKQVLKGEDTHTWLGRWPQKSKQVILTTQHYNEINQEWTNVQAVKSIRCDEFWSPGDLITRLVWYLNGQLVYIIIKILNLYIILFYWYQNKKCDLYLNYEDNKNNERKG